MEKETQTKTTRKNIR